MGIGFFGFPDVSDEEKKKQNRRVKRSLHEDKMKLLNGIQKGIKNPGTNKIIGDLLRSAAPLQKTKVRFHLQNKIDYWERVGAPIEAGIARRALDAFNQRRYDNGHIARYLTEEDIDRIFGHKRRGSSKNV